jgi:ribosome-associated protein
MSRKPKKGYYVRGEFVAEGSELDLELKRELKGTSEASRTELKRESTELQKLGEELLTLRADLMNGLDVPEKLRDALADARRITNFEGKRRQMQFVGKLMRQLEPDTLAAVRAALQEQHQGSAQLTLALHRAEQWRDRLIAEDDAFGDWVQRFAGTDAQQLRALIRQARKDAPAPDKAAVSHGLAPRQGRAYREIFQLVREQLASADSAGECLRPRCRESGRARLTSRTLPFVNPSISRFAP